MTPQDPSPVPSDEDPAAPFGGAGDPTAVPSGADSDLSGPPADAGGAPGPDLGQPEPGVLAPPGGARTPDPLPELRALGPVVEAVLLVADVPVAAVTLAQVLERTTDDVEATLADLAQQYSDQDRGFELRQVAGGWRLSTRTEWAPWVERYVLDGQQARLTQAALETLAVIAYRQPVTRSRVSAVRGVNVDGVVRTLLARGLVAEAGQDGDTGGVLYRTTPLLLERLGLQTLDDLPSLGPLLPELDDVLDDQRST
jgi:segregation and condensation protein B